MLRHASLAALVLTLVPAAAAADVLKGYAELNAGGMYGKGIAGTQQADAFFGKARGGAFGGAIGARLLFIDGQISHHEFISPDRTTWTQFRLGVAFGFDMGSEWDKKQHQAMYLDLGGGVSFGLGTGAQVMPPLDNSQVTDKGFLLDGRIEVGKHLSNIFDIGVLVPVSWAYLFKNGAGANNTDNQYQSVQVEAFVVLRANLRLI